MMTYNLMQAYLNTEYYLPEEDLSIHIGSNNDRLDQLLERRQTMSYGIITAANPKSFYLNQVENQTRLLQLDRQLEKEGKSWIISANRAPIDKRWSEESRFILNLTLEEGLHLAKAYAQNALVMGMKNHVPELVLL